MLTEMFEEQRKFTAKVLLSNGFDLEKLTSDEKVQWTKEYLLSIVKELTEVLDNVNWKKHRQRLDPFNQNNLLQEIIDVQKFLWGLAILWNVDAKQLEEMFWQKSYVVQKRWDHEHINLSKPIAILDLDGVLCQYPRSFLDWVDNNIPGVGPLSKKKNPVAWEEAKRQYREKHGKRLAIPVEGAAEFTQKLKELGWKIVIYSYRPKFLYNDIEYDTFKWLDDHQFAYDKFVWAAMEKSFYLKSGVLDCDFFIDDDEETCISVANLGKKVFSPVVQSENVFKYGNFEEVLEEVRKLDSETVR